MGNDPLPSHVIRLGDDDEVLPTVMGYRRYIYAAFFSFAIQSKPAMICWVASWPV